MLQQKLKTQQIGKTEYTDSKKQRHTVKHCVIFSDMEKRELEEKIVEDLYRIFTAHTNGTAVS